MASGRICRRELGCRGEKRLHPGRAKPWEGGLCGRGTVEECASREYVEVLTDGYVVGGTERGI